MNIIQDTISGALILSVFDFVACFFVLYFISFFIRAIRLLDLKKAAPKDVGVVAVGTGANAMKGETAG